MTIKRYLLSFALVLVSLLLMMGNSEGRLARASWFGRTIFFPVSQSLRWVETTKELRQELNILQKQVVEHKLHNLSLQNELRVYFNTREISFADDNTVFEIAEVIGYSGQFSERSLMVDKGRWHGVAKDDAVISAVGIIGKIVLVSDTYSIVLPYSNPQFQLPVMNHKTSVQGILQADIGGKVAMNMIRLGSEIAVGDTIVTSNLSTLFPKGYPVGRVGRIKESQDNLFISAEIHPFTLVENLEHVFILKQRQKDE
ncbi:MAG: rod shape-determining protein MreC [Candidatus Cloacimonadaceae bacterium]|nr:rod shape-determining protein MreC [Candidatus Cloacimonadaceae bacterium]